MKYFILIVMIALPGEKVDHYLYDKMSFRDLEECQAFGNQYWQPLTNLAVMKYKGKDWANIYCIPENNANSELIESILNEKGI